LLVRIELYLVILVIVLNNQNYHNCQWSKIVYLYFVMQNCKLM